MKKIFKRLTASLLACIMMIGAMPALELFAAGPSTMKVLNFNAASNTYTISISFNDFATTNSSGIYNWSLERFYVRYWNMTTGETENDNSRIPIAYTPGGNTGEVTITVPLTQGCLYGFSVNGYYNDSVNANSYEQSIDTKFIFLTEIVVNAVGNDHVMNMDWDIATIGGQTFFPSYNIYYTPILTQFYTQGEYPTLQWKGPYNVDASQLTPITGTRRASYDFGLNAFVAGDLYGIRVDPILPNGTSALDAAENNQVAYTDATGSYKMALNTNKYYKTDRAYIRPNVEVTYSDMTHVTLTWTALDGFPVSEFINEIHIYRQFMNTYGILETHRETIVTGPTASTQNYVTIDRPNEENTTFYIEILFNTITYVDWRSPTRYQIENMIMQSEHALYDPLMVTFEPYRPDIYSITDNRQSPFYLDIVWKAFLREAYRDDEITTAAYDNKYLDKDLTYQVRITDDPQNFDGIPDEMVYEFQGNDMSVRDIMLPIDGKLTPHFEQRFNYYVTKNGGTFEQKDFVSNKIYYVSIVAIRNATKQKSQIAYGAHYIIPTEPIPIEPNMIAKPPLRIKVVDGVEEITETTITIEWDEQWIELYNPNDGKWYSKAGVSGGAIQYGDAVSDEDNILVNLRDTNSNNILNEAVTKNNIKNAIETAVPGTIPVLRMIDVTGANYRVHTAEYSTLATSGYDAYYDELIKENTQYEWIEVTPTGTGTLEVIVSSCQNPDHAPLNEGIAYVIFLRPYVTSDEGDKLAYYPSYVTGTTLIGRGDVPIKPVVPILEPVDVTDMSVTVRWEYIQALTYELRFSDSMSNYSDGGISIPWSDIEANGKLVTDGGKLYMQYTIGNLFPNTIYYIWIRSMSEEYDEISDWSNPVEMTTLDIEAPPPPEGLGYASEQNVYYYNRDNGTNYRPYEADYMIIEFLRIAADLYYSGGGDGETAQQGGADGSGNVQYLPNPEVTYTYMTLFTDLIPNRSYYVRAKTRLHFTKGDDGIGIRSYSYILQASLDPTFLDPIEIEVPGVADISVGLYKDSEWVSVGLVTGMTSDEYDGDKNPNTYPLPDTDFEITFDTKTETLKWRFRSNQTGADGKRDNLVDERFISRLINSGAFTYEVDLTLYNKSRIPKIRVIEMPVTIFNTLNERKIDLMVIADNMTVTFPYDSLMTPEVLNMTGLDRNAKITLTITHNPAGLTHAAGYLSEPHKVSATLTGSNNQSTTIKTFNKPLTYSMKAHGTYNENTTNIAGYVQDENTGGWQHLDSTWDTVKQSVNFSSPKAASFSALGILTPQAYQGTTLPQMYRANSKLSILDMTVYDENATIHANQFNQIMAAALKGENMVYMNRDLSQADFVALGKAKLLVSGNLVTREVGISALVRLYEAKAQYPVTGYMSMLQTSYKDIAQADGQYQDSLLKAAELGFYRGATANPKGNLTMGDLMHILDMILLY